MLKNYLITSLTSCENLKLIKARVFNPDLALLFIPLCVPRVGGGGQAAVKRAERQLPDSLLQKVDQHHAWPFNGLKNPRQSNSIPDTFQSHMYRSYALCYYFCLQFAHGQNVAFPFLIRGG